MDQEGNIRLGDFGLATKHREKGETDPTEQDNYSEASSLYNAIEDISRLMSGSRSQRTGGARGVLSPETSNANESMTGGVGKKSRHRVEPQTSLSKIPLTRPSHFSRHNLLPSS